MLSSALASCAEPLWLLVLLLALLLLLLLLLLCWMSRQKGQ
jgi:hypothetical protein